MEKGGGSMERGRGGRWDLHQWQLTFTAFPVPCILPHKLMPAIGAVTRAIILLSRTSPTDHAVGMLGGVTGLLGVMAFVAGVDLKDVGLVGL